MIISVVAAKIWYLKKCAVFIVPSCICVALQISEQFCLQASARQRQPIRCQAQDRFQRKIAIQGGKDSLTHSTINLRQSDYSDPTV